MRLLAIGDVFADVGRKAIVQWLPELRREHAADFTIVNVENMAGGKGVDAAGVRDVIDAGADCLTSGNHIWSHRGHARVLDDTPRLLRPANYRDPCPGRGVVLLDSVGGVKVAVINLLGRLFVPPVDDPFLAADQLLDEVDNAEVVVVDFHAEATSEKVALARYLDGRVSAFFGTHTHVQTADAQVLPRGTGYITDLGMTGPHESVIGLRSELAIKRFRSGRPAKFEPAGGKPGLRGALFDIDESSGRCRSVERIARGPGGT